MEPKKVAWSEQFCHLRRKMVSGFGLGIGVCLFVVAVILLSYSIRSPLVEPMLQSFSSFGAVKNSSGVSWPFSSSSKKGLHKSVEKVSGKENVLKDNGGRNDLEKSQLGVVNERVKNGSFGGVKGKSLEQNGRVSLNSNEDGPKVRGGNGNSAVGISPSASTRTWGDAVSRSDNLIGENVTLLTGGKTEPVTIDSSEIRNTPLKSCDIYDGRWVEDHSKPYYPAGSCPYIDKDFNCHLNGRPDDGFLKWKWQPKSCNIPSLNATDFLERLRGQRLVFVGDSLNRNMWESLICILRHAIGDKKTVYEISGRREFKKRGFYAFRFEEYDCSVDFVSSPFLVRESSFKGRNGSFETLRLDTMDRTTSMYRNADIIVFNTGHWWTHEKTSRGEDYYQEGNYIHPRLKVLEAYKRALRTWAKWIDKNIKSKKSQVIFRGYSVTHFRGGQWNSGGQCHKESEPIFNETYLAKYPSKMRVLEYVLKDMNTSVIYLNISRLTDYRKDAHPSIYRLKYKSVKEQLAAEQAQDCSHWCLPGVPDTWNELLYASLLKAGRGSWKT